MTFGQMIFRINDVWLNDVDKHIEQKYTRAVYLVFGEMTLCFIQFRQNDVRANDVSGIRRSAERRRQVR